MNRYIYIGVCVINDIPLLIPTRSNQNGDVSG